MILVEPRFFMVTNIDKKFYLNLSNNFRVMTLNVYFLCVEFEQTIHRVLNNNENVARSRKQEMAEFRTNN